MTLALSLIGFVALIAAFAWWVNVGSARRHWRQAEEQARRDVIPVSRPTVRDRA